MSLSFAMHRVIHRLNLPPFHLSPLCPVRRRRRSPQRTRHRCPRLATQRDATVTLQGRNAFQAFVGSFRQASPYIVEHAASLFVVVIPGEVTPVPFCALSLDELSLMNRSSQRMLSSTHYWLIYNSFTVCFFASGVLQLTRCGFQAWVFSWL